MLRFTVITVCLLFALLAAAVLLSPATARPVLALSPNACVWTGVWLPFEGEVRLVQDGTAVSGSYFDGKGLIRGTVEGNVLRGEWKEAPSYSPPFEAGHFIFTMAADCSFYNGTAGLGDANCCLEWGASRAEDPPPSLAVQVERGTLSVDGQAILPGETYFLPTCPPGGRSPAFDCNTPFLLGSDTALKMSCFVSRLIRVVVVLERVELNQEDTDLLLEIITAKLMEKCGITTDRQDSWALNMRVQQGAAYINSFVDGHISVETDPATASLYAPGSFLAGYDPGDRTATLRAGGAGLVVAPDVGSAFILPPYSLVQVTAAGGGPVTALPRNYLPMQSR
jgi:hypothetical protein